MTQQTTKERIALLLKTELRVDRDGHIEIDDAADILATEIDEKDARIAELEEALESQVERSNWNNLTEAEKSRVLGMKP